MENAYKPLSKHGSEYCGSYVKLDGFALSTTGDFMTREQEVKMWIEKHGAAKVWRAIIEMLQQEKILPRKQ